LLVIATFELFLLLIFLVSVASLLRDLGRWGAALVPDFRGGTSWAS
jgi:hypothetical protein